MRIRALTSVLASLLISSVALAQPAKPDDDHSARHAPAGALAGASKAPPAPAGAPSTQAYERQMKAMQEMHLKLQAAKTPAERTALMNEHMKLMQAGMSMMGVMRGMGGPAGQSPQGGMDMMQMHAHMERRMAMTEQMMQMMIDRQADMPGK